MAVDLSIQKELYADPKAIQQIEFVGQLMKPNNNNNVIESMFVLTILEKIKETRFKFSQGSVTVLKKMGNYQEARVNRTNTQLNKLKFVANHKAETILRLNKKNFEDEELLHELFSQQDKQLK